MLPHLSILPFLKFAIFNYLLPLLELSDELNLTDIDLVLSWNTLYPFFPFHKAMLGNALVKCDQMFDGLLF